MSPIIGASEGLAMSCPLRLASVSERGRVII
jgi:hypothetical protein